MKNETSLNFEKPPIANVLLGEVLSERQKRQLAGAGHFSGAYKSMCRKNPIRDFQDKSGFVVVSTDRNFDDTVVTMSDLKQSQRDLLKEWNVL